MKLAGHKHCEAMYKICLSLTSEDLDPIKNTAIREMIVDLFPPSQQDDAMQFILHIFGKLQEELTPKSSNFQSANEDSYDEAWTKYILQYPSIIDNLFTGMYQKNITCKT